MGLVAERGVRGVSFREVARRSGVSHQAPYHHFGNLHGILRAIAIEGFDGLNAAMRAAAAGAGPDPADALTAAGVAYVNFATSHVGHFRVMFSQSLVDIHDEDAPLEEAGGTYGLLTQLTKEAQEAGYGQGIETLVMAHMSWSMVHGMSVLFVEGVLKYKTEGLTDAERAAHAEQVVAALTKLLKSGRTPPQSS